MVGLLAMNLTSRSVLVKSSSKDYIVSNSALKAIYVFVVMSQHCRAQTDALYTSFCVSFVSLFYRQIFCANRRFLSSMFVHRLTTKMVLFLSQLIANMTLVCFQKLHVTHPGASTLYQPWSKCTVVDVRGMVGLAVRTRLEQLSRKIVSYSEACSYIS